MLEEHEREMKNTGVDGVPYKVRNVESGVRKINTLLMARLKGDIVTLQI